MSFIRKLKLLSPPVSPQTKTNGNDYHVPQVSIDLGRKAAESTKAFNAESFTLIDSRKAVSNNDCLTVKPFVMNKKAILSFLAAYTIRVEGTNEKHKKRKLSDKRSLNTERYASNKRSTRASNYLTKDKIDSLLSAKTSAGQNSTITSYQSSKSDSERITRDYRTRSKRINISDNSTDASSKSSSSGSDSAIYLKNYDSKIEFLKSTTVQEIHDSAIECIPVFDPSMDHVSTQFLEKELKRVGFSTSRDLKDSTGLELVDEKEIVIVRSIKLSPYQYYDTKKRFFAEKARKVLLQTTFKKTDAQKACRVDVNKASKLYEIFQSCGLLEDELYVIHDFERMI